MLSPGASNALLKTLEEPPPHVVFVLATTDPHKVLATIRSRTQHYEFHLLPADVLAEHVRWVIDDAGLDVAPEVVDHVVRQGGGSARDTLSALDQAVAAGGVAPDGSHIEDLVEAICDVDAGPRHQGGGRRHVRRPRPAHARRGAARAGCARCSWSAWAHRSTRPTEADRDRAKAWAERLGDRAVTRAMEEVGQALLEMRQATEPRIALEVALVHLTRPETHRRHRRAVGPHRAARTGAGRFGGAARPAAAPRSRAAGARARRPARSGASRRCGPPRPRPTPAAPPPVPRAKAAKPPVAGPGRAPAAAAARTRPRSRRAHPRLGRCRAAPAQRPDQGHLRRGPVPPARGRLRRVRAAERGAPREVRAEAARGRGGPAGALRPPAPAQAGGRPGRAGRPGPNAAPSRSPSPTSTSTSTSATPSRRRTSRPTSTASPTPSPAPSCCRRRADGCARRGEPGPTTPVVPDDDRGSRRSRRPGRAVRRGRRRGRRPGLQRPARAGHARCSSRWPRSRSGRRRPSSRASPAAAW